MTENSIISGFYAVTTAKRKPDEILIDNMTSFAPSLKKLEWSKANGAIHHQYREVAEIKGITDVYNFDSPVPDLSVSFTRNHVNLTPFAGAIHIGQDTAKLIGNKDEFFIEQATFIARDLGMKLERSIFENIVRTAYDKNRRFILNEEEEDAAMYNSLAILTPTSGECCGLYSPAYGKLDTDRIFELEKLANGTLYEDKTGRMVFGTLFKVVLGLLLANKRMYAIVSNVDPAAAGFEQSFPEKMSAVLDEMLVNDKTIILMSNRLKTAIGNKYTTAKTVNMLIRFDEVCNLSVCGVPVIASANIPTKVDWTKIVGLPTG